MKKGPDEYFKKKHDFDNHYLIYFVFQSLCLWSWRVAVFRISDNIANIESKLRTFRIQISDRIKKSSRIRGSSAKDIEPNLFKTLANVMEKK